MANKEYQMLFKLGAQLGSNFNGTFSSAQKVLQTTQKEIQALNKTQFDIGAYQRQQQGIEKTNEKLELYKKQLDNVQKEMSESGEYSSTLANKELELQQRIRNTEEQIAVKNQKLAEMSNRLTEAGIDVNDLTAESTRLESEMRNLQNEEEKAAAEAAKFGDTGASAFETVGSALVAAGIATALNKIADEYKACVEASMEFGYTMSTVEALSGASVTEMQTLTATAKELGATTAFTANQSAQAMTYMGMAGWNAGQMVSGMDGVLNLAAASGEDLANVSDIVTDNLTAFGLKASDTAHFSDVLAAAATNSNTSVGIMGETFSGSAAIAGALGYSIEDVAVAVGEMANAGVKGSVAGTALKNMFNGLLGGATLTSSAFGEVEFTAINADGTMKGFSETIDELRGYFDQMTEAERVNNAMTIAGQRGYNGLLAILNTTDEDYRKLSDSINNCTGAAQKMANIKLDNLQGDVTLLDSATDGLRMTIGGLYEGELRQTAQVGTEIITKINEFCEQNPAVVKALMAITAEIGLVVAGYTAFTTVKKVKNALDAAGAALSAKKAAAAAAAAVAEGAEATATTGAAAAQTGLNTAMLASPIFIITAAVAALTAGLVILREAYKMQEFETQTLSTATKQQYDRVDELNAQYAEACEKYGETSDQARSLKYDLDEATAAIDNQSFSVKDLYAEIDTLHSSTSGLLEDCRSSTASIDEQYESAMILSAKLRDLASSSDKSATSQAKMEPIVKRLNEMYPGLGLTIENVSDKMGDLNGQIEQAAKSQSLQAKYETAKNNLSELYVKQQQLQEAAEKANAAQAKAAKAYSDAAGDNVFSAVGGLVVGTVQDTEKAFNEASEKSRTAYEDLAAVEAQIRECETAMEEYGGVVSGTSEETVSAYDAVSIAVSDVTAETEELLKAYNDAYQAAYDSISGQYALWDEAADVSAVSIETINENLEQQATYWDNYNENLNSLLGRAGEIDGLKDVIATFADGSSDSVNAIAGMASASDDDLRQMVENWQKVQEEQNKTAEALADTKVDFKEQLDGIANDMSAAIENMNLSAEAKTAAEETIKAYADAIAAGKGSVVEAADIVAAAVGNALGIASDSDNKPLSGGDYVKGFHAIDAYASGTDYANAGYALVGEEGPEIVKFGGGEKVYPNDKTMAILGNSAHNSGGGQTVVNISPQFIVNGNADRSMFEEWSEQLVELVRDTLRDEGIDARRGAYV